MIKTVIKIFLALEGVLFALLIWSCAEDAVFGGWSFGGVFYDLLLFICSGLCVLFSLFALRKRGTAGIALVSLIVSAFMMFPFVSIPFARGISFLVGPVVGPWIQHREEARIELKVKDFEALPAKHYAELSHFFKGKKKIIEVRGPWMLLEDKKVVILFGASHYQMLPEFESFMKDNVLRNNSEVEMRLPDSADFNNEYIPGSHSGVFSGLYGLEFGDIPILIYLDGRLINLDYAQRGYKKTLYKYQ